MKKPKVTIAIPTRNRAVFLKRAMRCVLGQTFTDFELLVIDNASSDGTKQVVDSFQDTRIHYFKNKTDTGIIKNWNKCIVYAQGEYLNIFHDDDVMYATFIEEAVNALEKHRSVGFTFPLLRRVDTKRNFLNMWWEDYDNKSRYLSGLEYIRLTIEKERCISLAPSMVFRKEIFKTVGSFKQVYGYNTFDFNMWFKIAFQYDTYLIPKILFEYTIHPDQMSQLHWRTPEAPTGPIGMAIEIIDAIAHLIKGKHISYGQRKFLSEKLLILNKQVADLIKVSIKHF